MCGYWVVRTKADKIDCRLKYPRFSWRLACLDCEDERKAPIEVSSVLKGGFAQDLELGAFCVQVARVLSAADQARVDVRKCNLTSTSSVTQIFASAATSMHVPYLNPFRPVELWGKAQAHMMVRWSMGTQCKCDQRPLCHCSLLRTLGGIHADELSYM